MTLGCSEYVGPPGILQRIIEEASSHAERADRKETPLKELGKGESEWNCFDPKEELCNDAQDVEMS